MAEKPFIIERVLVMEGDVEVRSARSTRDRIAAADPQDAVTRYAAAIGAEVVGISGDSQNERASAIVQAGEKIYRLFAFPE